MSARILVVDDLVPNVRLLEAKLAREYFEVLTASSGAEALEIAAAENPDIVLLDVMMPEMDGFEVCRRLKADPDTMHIPVVMVTALNDAVDRVQGLEAGADDFLSKPINDVALLARVRSLLRLKLMLDELRLREVTGSGFGIAEGRPEQTNGLGGRILVIEDREVYARNIEQALADDHIVVITADAEEALHELRTGEPDLLVVSLGLRAQDGLRLCSQMRSMDEGRHVPQLILVDDSPADLERLIKGLDFGVNDYLIRPIDPNELKARVRTQVRHRRFQSRLRANVQMSVAMAVTDSLTGVHNRNYLESHLGNLVQRALRDGKSAALLMLDLDRFKEINDSHGHAAGDEALKEFTIRVRREIRGIDLLARFGGEEFVVLMPDADAAQGQAVAERLRQLVAEEPFRLNYSGIDIPVTVSIGVAISQRDTDTGEDMLRRADEALYAAKNQGRNRVVLAEADIPPDEIRRA